MFLFLVSCAKPHVVEIVKSSDEDLNCAPLKDEYIEMNDFIDKASDVKGVTWGNAARLLAFPPAIIGTYGNANEAIQAANSRKVHLVNLKFLNFHL